MTEDIIKEINQAKDKYGHFNSTHEVYGVLKEELDEFWELVRTPAGDGGPEMIEELTQIAAIAIRAAGELKNDQIKWI